MERKEERVGVEYVRILTKMVYVQILQKPFTHSLTPTHSTAQWTTNQRQLRALLANVSQDQMVEGTMIQNNISFCVGGKPTNQVTQRIHFPIGKEVVSIMNLKA